MSDVAVQLQQKGIARAEDLREVAIRIRIGRQVNAKLAGGALEEEVIVEGDDAAETCPNQDLMALRGQQVRWYLALNRVAKERPGDSFQDLGGIEVLTLVDALESSRDLLLPLRTGALALSCDPTQKIRPVGSAGLDRKPGADDQDGPATTDGIDESRRGLGNLHSAPHEHPSDWRSSRVRIGPTSLCARSA
jgi:hypothetical protein